MDPAESDVLGDPYNDRIRSRGGRHSHQPSGAACDAVGGPHAHTFWYSGLGAAPRRSLRSAPELVGIRPNFSDRRKLLDGCRFKSLLEAGIELHLAKIRTTKVLS